MDATTSLLWAIAKPAALLGLGLLVIQRATDVTR